MKTPTEHQLLAVEVAMNSNLDVVELATTYTITELRFLSFCIKTKHSRLDLNRANPPFRIYVSVKLLLDSMRQAHRVFSISRLNPTLHILK